MPVTQVRQLQSHLKTLSMQIAGGERLACLPEALPGARPCLTPRQRARPWLFQAHPAPHDCLCSLTEVRQAQVQRMRSACLLWTWTACPSRTCGGSSRRSVSLCPSQPAKRRLSTCPPAMRCPGAPVGVHARPRCVPAACVGAGDQRSAPQGAAGGAHAAQSCHGGAGRDRTMKGVATLVPKRRMLEAPQ